MMKNTIAVFYAKNDHPFDKGCELELLEDYRRDGSQSGLFLGYKSGKLIEIMCEFKEIEVRHVRE